MLLHLSSHARPTSASVAASVLLRSAAAARRLLHSASPGHHAYDYFYGAEDSSSAAAEQQDSSTGQVSNTAAAALQQGVVSRIIEFQTSTDDAIQRYNQYQADACKGMHAAGLLSSKPPTTVRAAYFPVWCFSATICAEYQGQLGFKDPGGGMVWKEMEDDWHTLVHKQQLRWQDYPSLQVYASYNYERSLGEAALLPDANSLSAARPLQPSEADALCAAAGRAATPSRVLTQEQQGPAGPQQPMFNAQSQSATAVTDQPGGDIPSASSLPDEAESGQQGPASSSSQAGSGRQQACPQGSVVIHPPDMQQGIAWQLAYRSLMLELTQQASKAAMQGSGAADVKDMHVSVQVHSVTSELLYMPVYVAHYQHGSRYKLGTSTVIKPQMFYATISGLPQGRLVAPTHVSPIKTQAATASVVGGLGLAASAPSWWGLAEPLLSVGPVESLTLAVISAAMAGIWARGRPQAHRNELTAKQVRAERDFYRQYDARETKTAAAMAAAEAEGQGVFTNTEEGEQADEFIQWLWMDYDWRRWQCDEPWNWDPMKKRREAEAIAERTVHRRRQRQEFLQRLLDNRRKREYELEQEMLRAQRGKRAPGSRRPNVNAREWEFADMGAGMARRRRDFLGYYKLMGIAEEDDVTVESIKAAFKAQAMQLHPDRVAAAGGGAADAQEAHVRFQRLQMAYDVLKDPEKRSAYDRGQLIQ